MRRLIAAMLLVTCIATQSRATSDSACPNEPMMPPLSLPHLRDAFERDEPIVIVALGSSSTSGSMASDANHAYPAILQKILSQTLPEAHIAVINRGIAGQDAAEEVARLDADVVAVKPQLVIWQVGANSTLREADPSVFRHVVVAGVNRLRSAHADVVLMDNQRAPRILDKPRHLLIDQALADIATETGVNLFPRSTLMDAWRRDGRPYELFISRDGLHHNDLGYHCVAMALAREIEASIRH
jgi:acyl-CoA thioesterase-1